MRNILCVGDSLTAGYFNYLENHINSNNINISKINFDGFCVNEILNFLKENYNCLYNTEIILLCGTNDLGDIDYNENETISEYKNLYNILDKLGTRKLYQLSIPYNKLDKFEEEYINKTNLNFNIKQLGFKNKIFIDLNLSKCNYLNQEKQESYWKIVSIIQI